MDKILSARVDESIIRRIGSLARLLNTSKKKIIEGAIKMYASKIEEENNQDIFDQTFGAWQREETPSETARKVREAFQQSMLRRYK